MVLSRGGCRRIFSSRGKFACPSMEVPWVSSPGCAPALGFRMAGEVSQRAHNPVRREFAVTPAPKRELSPGRWCQRRATGRDQTQLCAYRAPAAGLPLAGKVAPQFQASGRHRGSASRGRRTQVSFAPRRRHQGAGIVHDIISSSCASQMRSRWSAVKVTAQTQRPRAGVVRAISRMVPLGTIGTSGFSACSQAQRAAR